MSQEFNDNVNKSVITFKREQAQTCFAEAIPMIERHWQEIEQYTDLKLDPEFARYAQLEESGFLRAYTARDEKNNLVGYAVFFFSPHLHFRQNIFACQDILYISPEKRGFGLRFIDWCDKQLFNDGAYVIYRAVSLTRDYSVILRRLGYSIADHIYTRRNITCPKSEQL